jgi:hypothetical protein
MYTTGTVLKTDADLTNAVLFQLRVTVFQHGEIIDYGGVIEELSEHSVKIGDSHFFRETCEFRVR